MGTRETWETNQRDCLKKQMRETPSRTKAFKLGNELGEIRE